MDLTGQVALITGASRGIGKATAKAFADAGARVILSSRSKDALVAAASEIEGETAIFAANAGSPAQATACVGFAMDAFGRVDILVNNAATNPYFGPAIEIDLPRLDKTMEVNLRGPLLWSQECWKAWMGMNGGTIHQHFIDWWYVNRTRLGHVQRHEGGPHSPSPKCLLKNCHLGYA